MKTLNTGRNTLLYLAIFCLLCLKPDGVKASVNVEGQKMAIVISKANYDSIVGVRNVAMGWAAIANMSGIPYDCLFLSDIASEETLSKYNLLVLAQCSHVEEILYQATLKNLSKYLAEDEKHLLIDGPFALYNEEGKERDHSALDQLLGIEFAGFQGDDNFRIKVKESDHFITAALDEKQYVTQHMTDGLNIIQFKDNPAEPLLISTNEKKSYPFLSCRNTEGNRTVLVSDFGIESGVSSFFRNSPEPLFYPNEIFNILTRSVQWAIYGDIQNPIPVPQLSNANLAAIIRLDADGSSNIEVQKETLGYLTDIAKETGVLTVYGLVSDWVERGNWDSVAPLAQTLEDFGGQIGTHSKTHGITRNHKWEEEFNGAKRAIQENIAARGYDIDTVDYLINPGNTIPMRYYGEIAKRFSFFMTHGGEQKMPLGYGNLNWFTESHKDMVVLQNTPAPDYQWFYMGTWSYSTQQITAYEEAIFDHMYTNVGKGVVFNEMWHDYSITANKETEPPRTQAMRESGSRIINESNIALYDAMKTKFLTHDIYCPGPVDLRYKLLAMARWNCDWKYDNQQLDIELDLSAIEPEEIVDYTGGMGIRIDNTRDYIQSVMINGEPHKAFDDHMVILPNLKKGINRIQVSLGPIPSTALHLSYVSKRMPWVKSSDIGIEAQILTKSKAKFSLKVKKPAILLNSDFQEWNRKGDHILKGYVTSNRQIVLAEHEKSDFYISRATLPISDFDLSDTRITFQLKSIEKAAEMWFQMNSAPQKVLLGNELVEIKKENQHYKLSIPVFSDTEKLTIVF